MISAVKEQSILVKRYARGRLYETQNQSYVSVEQLRGWAAKDVAFSVVDTDTDTEVTKALLASCRIGSSLATATPTGARR